MIQTIFCNRQSVKLEGLERKGEDMCRTDCEASLPYKAIPDDSLNALNRFPSGSI